MDPSLARKVHTVLQRVFAVDPGQRMRFLTDQCSLDPQLAQCRELLFAAIAENEFLEMPALGSITNAEKLKAPVVPERVANYRILRPIGSGGMATVYEAVQDQPSRRVALKVSRLSPDEDCEAPRLRYESEVLAKLRHPAIAQIYEAGVHTSAGSTPFAWFALEFVPDALTLVEYANKKSLSDETRLCLFCQVCSAVQHGHQNGIIHRDLKPGNILVDGDGNPKVIDFGIARSNDFERTQPNPESERQFFGTLNYMSPEQFDTATGIDARTDVYSLGVVLYELICGKLPRALSGSTVAEALQRLQLEPVRSPRQHRSDLSPDLEAVLMVALERDPNRRYRTVDALESEIRRYLGNFPVEARPASIVHQTKLFAVRNRLFVTGLGIALAAILLGSAFSAYFGWHMWRESRERLAAEQMATRQRDEALWQTYIANISAGFSAFRAREYRQLRDRLAAAPREHRGWEWDLLEGFAELSDVTVAAHKDMIFDLAVCRSKPVLATACRDGTIKTWNLETFKPIRQINVSSLSTSTDPRAVQVHSIDISPDDQWLAAGLEDGSIAVFDLDSGKLLSQRAGPDSRVAHIACGAGGSIVSTYRNGEAWIWFMIQRSPGALSSADTNPTPELVSTGSGLPGAQTDVQGARFSPNGRFLATWDGAGGICLRSGNTFEVIQKWRADDRQVIGQAEFDPTATLCAAGCDEGQIFVWEVANPSQSPRKFSLPGPRSAISTIAFANDGRRLFVGRNDRSISEINIESEQVSASLNGHEEAVSGLWFDSSRDRLISTSWDRTIRSWNLAPEAQLNNIGILLGHEDEILTGAWSRDGAVILTGSRDGTLRFWDPARRALLGSLKMPGGDFVRSVAVSPSEPILAAGCNSGNVHLIDSRTADLLAIVPAHEESIWSVAFSNDGLRLATAGNDRVARLWAVNNQQMLAEFVGHEARITQVTFNPDGSQAVTSSRDQTVRIWDAASGRQLHQLQGHESDVFDVLFGPDPRILFSGSRDQSIRVWDADTGRFLDGLPGQGQFITSLSTSPDGLRLAAGSWFGEIVIWELPSRRAITSIKAHDQAVRELAFSPDGFRLMTVSNDRSVRIFDSRSTKQRGDSAREAAEQYEIARAWLTDFRDRYSRELSTSIRQTSSPENWNVANDREFRNQAVIAIETMPPAVRAAHRNVLLELLLTNRISQDDAAVSD